jgi:hypothetical protein
VKVPENGRKVYGATVVGPHSRIGGEVNNSVISAYSNKGHDGFRKLSAWEWCNIGADSNNSNLKNNYEEVNCGVMKQKVLLKLVCSLWIDDGRSQCGINTMFNTGTVIE